MIQIDAPLPNRCYECPFASADFYNGIMSLSCITPIGRSMYAPDLIDRKDRPDWCPLKEQEAVEPFHKCIDKDFTLIEDSHFDYCPYCGKPITWAKLEGR